MEREFEKCPIKYESMRSVHIEKSETQNNISGNMSLIFSRRVTHQYVVTDLNLLVTLLLM